MEQLRQLKTEKPIFHLTINRMKKLFSFILLIVPVTLAQNSGNKIPVDTSYTIYSATAKIHEKFPDAVPVIFSPTENVKVVKDIVYTAVGYRKLHLDIFYPSKREKKYSPAVILVHGGGWRSGNRTMVYPMAERLTENGYVTVAVEYRLSIEAFYPAAVYDIKSAIRWVRANAEKFKINKNMIAIYGTSAGGHLAALVGTTNNDKKFEGNEDNLNFSSGVEAIVDVDGVVDYFGKGSEELYKKSGKPSAGQLWFGVSPKDNPEIWREAGPINHISAETPPVCFINSTIPRFHAGRDEMIKILDKYNIYSEVHILPGTVHTFWLFHPWFKKTFEYTLSFLNKVLGIN